METINKIVWTGASVLIGAVVCVVAGSTLVVATKAAKEQLEQLEHLDNKN